MIDLGRRYSDEELSKFSDEEKVNIATLAFAAEQNDYGIRVLKSISNDSLKLSLIERSKLSPREKVNTFVKVIKSDDVKLELIKNRGKSSFGRLAIVVAENIDDDNKKVESLQYFDSDFEKSEVILTIKSDEKKKELIEEGYLKVDVCQAAIIRSVKDLETRIELINGMNNFIEQDRLIAEIRPQNEEEKVLVVKKLKLKTSDKYKIIKGLKDKDVAEELLISLFPDYSIETIRGAFLSSDVDERLSYLKYLTKTEHKEFVINEIEIDSDETLEKIIANARDSYIETIYALRIDDEITRAKYIDVFEGQMYKVEILDSLTSPELKLKYIEQVQDKEKQQRIIKSIKEDKAKIDCLSNIQDENLKARILMSVKDDKKKKKALEQIEIEDETNLAIIIGSFVNDDIKQEYIQRIKDRGNKALIEIELRSRELITKALLCPNRKYTRIGIDERITIGTEIEAEGPLSKEWLLKKKILEDWDVKDDSSLEDGVEISSPKMTDSKVSVENIYIICEALARCNEHTSERCGGHIHIGANYLKSKEAYMNLFDIWGNAERLIYKISNQKGEIPRYCIPEYAAPISSKLNEALEKETINLADEESLDNFICQVINAEESRFTGLNLLNVINSKKTIEFRIPNGSINPDTWIENIMLFGRMIEVSEKLAEIEKKDEIIQTPREKEQLRLRNALKEDIDEKEKLEILLDMLFTEEEQDKKQVYVDRYIVANEIIENIPLDRDPFRETEFSGVDFKKKKKEKHDKDEFEDLIREMDIQGINDAIRMIRDEIIVPDRDDKEDI